MELELKLSYPPVLLSSYPPILLSSYPPILLSSYPPLFLLCSRPPIQHFANLLRQLHGRKGLRQERR